MPVITEPFEVMAFDLVGPYERSQHGYKYVLTAMCLASKYPEAIPLKDVRAETVWWRYLVGQVYPRRC